MTHVDGVDDDFSYMPARVRSTVVALQVEVQTLAALLNRHPRLRSEANVLRDAAVEMFSEDSDSGDDDSDAEGNEP